MATVNGTNSSETIDAIDGVTKDNDTIYGQGGNDSIFGLGGNDRLFGGEGADHLDGGAGSDYAYYTDSSTGVTVNLLTGIGSGGEAQGDTFVSIENLNGSQHIDFLVGDGGSNTFWADRGDDTLKGGGGDDDLYGEAGDDVMKGSGGADVLSGGSGHDIAAYTDSDEGVFVSLLANVGSGGDAAGDAPHGIENLAGSTHADTLAGDDTNNVLYGLDDNDILKGYGGMDMLWGGIGHDSLRGMSATTRCAARPATTT